jgi:hypothetical protein
LKPQRDDFRSGLSRAVVFSATEDGVSTDLIGVKAAFLYAENVELASARLYYALLAMRMHKGSQRGEDRQPDLRDLEQAVGLTDDTESEKASTYLLPASRRDILAVKELAEGFRMKAFSLTPYHKQVAHEAQNTVVKTTFDLMRGKVWPPDIVPVLDQPTLDRLQGFTRITLQTTEPNAPGPLTRRADRVLARRPWLANEFLGHMPDFPGAKWDFLLEVREELKDERDNLFVTMGELARDMSELTEARTDPETPGEIVEHASDVWELKVKGEINQIRRKLRGLRMRSELTRFVTAGALTSSIAVGVGVGGSFIANHPELTTAGALSIAGLATSLVQQTKARRGVKEEAKVMPYWFLHKAAHYWQDPIWDSGEQDL